MSLNPYFRFFLYIAIAILLFIFLPKLAWMTIIVFSCSLALLLMVKLGKVHDKLQPAIIGFRKSLPFSSDTANYSYKNTAVEKPVSNKQEHHEEVRKPDDNSRLQQEVRRELELLVDYQDEALEVINNIIEQVKVAQSKNQPGFGVHSSAVLFAVSGPSGSGKTHISNVLGKLFYCFGALPSQRTVLLNKSKLSGYHPSAVIEEYLGSTNGGAIVLDDADWIVETDPYTQVTAIDDIGSALAEFVIANPKQYIVTVNATPNVIEALLMSDQHKKWLRHFHIVEIKLNNLGSKSMLEILNQLLKHNDWSLVKDAQAKVDAYFNKLAKQQHFSNAHDARNLSDKLMAYKMQQGASNNRVITQQDINEVVKND